MKHRIVVCMGSSCFARGNERNLRLIRDFLKKNRLEDSVELAGARCTGGCEKGPNILIDGEIFHRMDPEVLFDVLTSRFLAGASSGPEERKEFLP